MTSLQKELLRKFLHLTELLIIGGYIALEEFFGARIALLGLTAVLLILLEIEYVRIAYKPKMMETLNDVIYRMGILRRAEKDNITGAIFFVISTIIAFGAFDFPIALLALLFNTFGDLAAALFGKAIGGKKIFKNKTYAGTFAGLVMNLLVGIVILPEQPLIFVPMAITAATVEVLTHKLDDNLTVPLFSGFAGQAIVFILASYFPHLL